MASFLSFLGWLHVLLSPEVPVSIRCGLRVFGFYSLRGAEVAAGLFAGLSCAQSATAPTPWLPRLVEFRIGNPSLAVMPNRTYPAIAT